MSTTSSTSSSANVLILNTAHPGAASLSGSVTVLRTSLSQQRISGTITGDVEVVAGVGTSSTLISVAFRPGDGTRPNAGLFGLRNPSQFTANGWRIFDASVDYLAGP
jgi:hypothetical protein